MKKHPYGHKKRRPLKLRIANENHLNYVEHARLELATSTLPVSRSSQMS